MFITFCIEAERSVCHLSVWGWRNSFLPAVVDLLYWRDLQRTGVVFGASLFLLLSLSVCSIISVISYMALALLSVTVTFRIYKGILQAVQKSEDGHPFKWGPTCATYCSCVSRISTPCFVHFVLPECITVRIILLWSVCVLVSVRRQICGA